MADEAEEAAAEELTVVVDCEDVRDGSKLYQRVSGGCTAAELLERWAADVGVPAASALLTTADGERVEAARRLADLGKVEKMERMVIVRAAEACSILAGVYSGPPDRRPVLAQLSAPPEELEHHVRDALGLPADRPLRLRLPAGPLRPGVALRAQGVAAGVEVLAELGVRVSLREAWAGEQLPLLLHTGDPCALLASDAAGPQRLASGGRRARLDPDRQLADALAELGAAGQPSVDLTVETAREAVAVVGGLLRAASVWPTDRVRALLGPGPASAMLGRALVRLGAPLAGAGLPEAGLVHAGPVAVAVRRSDHRHCLVRVPALGAVADVKEAVRAGKDSPTFALSRRGEELADDAPVAGACPADGGSLDVVPIGVKLTVTLRDRSVRWRTHSRHLGFGELMAEVSRRGGVRMPDLVRRTLRCAGCGRAVWRAEEAHQLVPAPCCSVRSLTLVEPTKDAAGTQTARSSRGEPLHRSVGTSPRTEDQAVQATAIRRDFGTMTEGKKKAATVATDSARTQAMAAALCAPQGKSDRDESPCRSQTPPLPEDPPLRVLLSGSPPLLLPARPNDSLGSVVALLRLRRLLMGVADVRLPGGACLSARPGWRERSLAESGVAAGGELQVRPFLAPSVSVSVFEPQTTDVDTCVVAIPGAGPDWASIADEVARRSRRSMDSAVVTQQGRIYLRGGHRRRAIDSYKPVEGEFRLVDEDDGAEAEDTEATHLTLDVVRPGSGIAAAPAYLPRLYAFVGSQVCSLAEDGRFVPAERDLLCDPRALLLLRGLALMDGGDLLVTMLMLGTTDFVDLATGDVHVDREAAVSAWESGPGQWVRVWLPVVAGARLPRYPLPFGSVLDVYTRPGRTVALVEGRVTAREEIHADQVAERWITSTDLSQLDREITAAMTGP